MMEKDGGGDHESTSTVGSFFESSINSVESSSSELVEDASSSSTSNSSLSLSASPLSRRNGPLYELSELMTNLPIKRGLSKYYDGKSESFASIERVESLENLAKRKKASFSHYNKKLKGSRSNGGGLESDDTKSGDPTPITVQKASEVVISVVGPEFETTAMAVAPRPKRQKFDLPSSPRILPLSVSKNERNSASIRSSEVGGAVAKSSEIDLRIQQAKNYAVAQALQDGCTGNFATTDSPFGNFLLPVVPSCAELYE